MINSHVIFNLIYDIELLLLLFLFHSGLTIIKTKADIVASLMFCFMITRLLVFLLFLFVNTNNDSNTIFFTFFSGVVKLC